MLQQTPPINNSVFTRLCCSRFVFLPEEQILFRPKQALLTLLLAQAKGRRWHIATVPRCPSDTWTPQFYTGHLAKEGRGKPMGHQLMEKSSL